MKIREKREERGFGGNPVTWVRVRTLAENEQPPPNAEQVADDTAEHDWDREDLRKAQG